MKTPKAGRREWVGLAVIALPCLLYSMDLTVLHLAVPRLTVDLEPSSARVAISMAALVENAARIDAAPKSAAPMRSMRRRPIRSPNVPAVMSDPATKKP